MPNKINNMPQTESAMAKVVDMTYQQERYDECVKKILSQKIVLAWILKKCVKEFAPYSVEQIMNDGIEGQPMVSVVAVDRDESDREAAEEQIEGKNTVDSSIDEGTVVYDILFTAVVPDTKEPIQLIINIEGQREDRVTYPVIKRAIYYASRMISAQKNTVFTKSHYEKIEKVYTIWINMNVPLERRNTITEYSIKETNHFGKVQEEISHYDLISVIMIGIGNPDDVDGDSLLNLLDTLFSSDKKPEEKKSILENNFDIAMTVALEKEVAEMGGIGRGIYLDAYEEASRTTERNTKVDAIISIMNDFGVSIEQAMRTLKVAEQEQSEYRRIVNERLAVAE